VFDDYFSESKRFSFVLAALGSNYTWHILPRYNVLTNLPSDFDVIRVDTSLCYRLINNNNDNNNTRTMFMVLNHDSQSLREFTCLMR